MDEFKRRAEKERQDMEKEYPLLAKSIARFKENPSIDGAKRIIEVAKLCSDELYNTANKVFGRYVEQGSLTMEEYKAVLLSVGIVASV